MARVVRLTRRRRAAERDQFIAKLTLAETLDRLILLAPDDVQAITVIAKQRLRQRWPTDFDTTVRRAG